MGLLDALRDKQFRSDVGQNANDFAQSASNSVLSNVTMPVDALAWLLRKGGMPIQNPVGGSDWAEQNGLLRVINHQTPSTVAGETAGGLLTAALFKPKIKP